MNKYISVLLCIVLCLSLLPSAIVKPTVNARESIEESWVLAEQEDIVEIESASKPLLTDEAPFTTTGDPQPDFFPFVPQPVTVSDSVYNDGDKSALDSMYASPQMAMMSGYTPDPAITAALGNLSIKTPQAPYSIASQQESISTLNGNLSVEAEDLTLPGRNGLSFTLKRYYDASSSSFYEEGVDPYVFCVCRVIFDATQHTQRLYNGQVYDDPTSYVTGRFEYNPDIIRDGTMNNIWDASGWSAYVHDRAGTYIYSAWSAPDQYGFQVRKATLFHQQLNVYFDPSSTQLFVGWKDRAKEQTYEEKLYPIGKGWMWNIPFIKTVEGKRYLNMQENGTYEISGSTLRGYPFQDLKIVYNNTVVVNGVRSQTVLQSIQGMSHYFDADGRLIQISDTYNNTITFHYSVHSTYGKVLTAIIDAIGNSITIAYTGSSVVLTQGDKTVQYNKYTEYIYDPLPPFRLLQTEMLSSVRDPLNRLTSYNYSVRDAAFSLVSTTPSKNNKVALLTRITHPTGATTEYSYEGSPVTRRIGSNAAQNVYRIASRKDVAAGLTYNLQNYSYTNPQGANTDYASSYGANINNFYVNVNDGLTTTVFDHRKKMANANELPQFYTNKVTQSAGDEQRTTTYQYDEVRRIPNPIQTNVQFKKGAATAPAIQTSVTYDNYGNVLTETNPLGVTTTNTYHPTTHLLSSISNPVQSNQTRYTEFTRNAQGSITRMTIRNQNASGAILAQVDYEDFDLYGNARRTVVKDDDRNIVYETEFGTAFQGAYPTKQTIAAKTHNNITETIIHSLDYYPQSGLIKSYTNGNGIGHVTQYQYDKGDRLIRVTHPDASFATVAYTDGASNQAIITDETGVRTRMRWDRLGNLTDEAILDGSYRILRTYGYDAYERVISERDNLNRTTNFQYDAWDRLTKTTYPGGSFALEEYDELNRRTIATDPEGNRWRSTNDILGRTVLTEEWRGGQYRQTAAMSYDYEGNVLTHTNATDTTTYTYDGLGQVIKVKDALNKEYQYSYTLAGMLKSIHYPDGNQIRKDYDEMGRLIRQTNELGLTDLYRYDANSNMTNHVDRKGQSFTYVYNNRNLLETKVAPGETIGYTYDAAGRRKTMSDATGLTSYQHKAATGELTRVTYPDNRSISYVYNSLGLRSSMTDPFGYMTYYTYDTRQRLTNVGPSTSNHDVSYTYYDNNLLKETVLGNGNKTLMNYEGVRLQSMAHRKADNAQLHSLQYDYDGNGNILNRSGVQGSVAIDETYTYDPLSRIATSSSFDEMYGYDIRDNRALLKSTQPLSELAFANRSYEYDSQNRLTKATIEDNEVNYRYNGDGHLYERTEDGLTTRYYYDGPHVIAEGTINSNGTATFKARYVRGHQLAARQATAGKAYYLHNGHGDVIELRDSTGNTSLNSYTYDIWGNPLTTNETIPNPFRYSGELWDATTELQYLRARWYDPSIGRFINKDTYEGELNNPLSLNFYTYVVSVKKNPPMNSREDMRS